ncbi:hypothetical protein M422DRAFT_242784 [Sphaerobolus stellatus SS14]|nr:hypothetical protein M422DRAFT_242784 [Sphaerobolus stellatus SS14]
MKVKPTFEGYTIVSSQHGRRINTSDIFIFNLDITTHTPALSPSAGSSQTPPPLNPTIVHPVPLICILVIAITDIV